MLVNWQMVKKIQKLWFNALTEDTN